MGLRYSLSAERDLSSIAHYTATQWGQLQMLRYLEDLEACCQQLAATPSIGRASDDIRLGLRRLECRKHVVFYRVDVEGILVLRILHQAMLVEQPLSEEDEP